MYGDMDLKSNTEGGRGEFCLFTINYVANRTFESQKNKHKVLYYAMVDFKKAYDSVNRQKTDRSLGEI